MKVQFTILIAICLAVLTSCKSAPAIPYEYSGITFSCPEGWEITDEIHKEKSHHLYMEKTGYSASGLITVNWIDGELEWEEYMDINIETFGGKKQLEGIAFSEPTDTVFNGYMALATNYTFSIMNIPHTGKILILGDDYKTISIILHEADEDTKENKEGFAAFTESFYLKPSGQDTLPL